MTTATVILRSRLLDDIGVPHAFTTRLGGVSADPFASLNFGNPMDLPPHVDRDPASNIADNFALVAGAIGARRREIVQVYQVHGSAAKVFRTGDPSRERRDQRPGEPPDTEFDFKADALVTDDPARLVAVRVADCTPVLLATRDGSVVAAVHAGWRGVVSSVVGSAIRAMRQVHASRIQLDPTTRMPVIHSPHEPPLIIAAIGPCIGPDAFEVGPEVVEEFRRAFEIPRDADGAIGTAAAIIRPHRDPQAAAAGKAFVDLQLALRLQLRSLGVEPIDVIAGCTFADRDRFFSHRRDRGVTGRMIGIVGPRDPHERPRSPTAPHERSSTNP